MRALVLSGGGSKGAFTAGVVKYLLREQAMDFDLAVGSSTGSLVSAPALLKDYNYCANIYTSLSDTDIFKNSLTGRILNFLGIVEGPVGASMAPLHALLSDYYLSQGKLQALLDTGRTAVVATVNVRTGKVHFVSSQEVAAEKIKAETFVKAIVASCCEPAFTQPIQVFKNENSPFKNDLFYDGGVKEFIPLEHAVTLGADEIWAVSTHPLQNEETDWGGTTPPDEVALLKALGWTVDALLDEVARGDRFRADLYFRWHKAKNEIIRKARELGLSDDHAKQLVDLPTNIDPVGRSLPQLRMIYPRKAMHTSLEFDPAIMMGYLQDGLLTAEQFFNEGAPLYSDATLRPWTRYA